MVIKEMVLSENEESILETLWREDRPLSRSEIIKSSPDRKWKTASFYGLLNSLLEKEAIKVEGIVPTGKNFGRAYIYNISKKEYDLMKLQMNMKEVSPDKDVFMNFMSGLVRSNKLDRKDLEELENILKEEIEK